jgi:hypothetical protein
VLNIGFAMAVSYTPTNTKRWKNAQNKAVIYLPNLIYLECSPSKTAFEYVLYLM